MRLETRYIDIGKSISIIDRNFHINFVSTISIIYGNTNRNPIILRRFRFSVNGSTPTSWMIAVFYWNTTTGKNFYHRCVCVQVKCENQMQKIFFHIISQVGLSEFSHTAWYSSYCAITLDPSTKQPQTRNTSTAIRYCLVINILSLWLIIWKKKKNPS